MRVCSLCRRCYDDSVGSCAEESHPPLSETRSGDPQMIAGYRFDQLLESGVKGDTYRARQTASGQSCRIRILTPGPPNRQQFLDDAKLASALFHPNVVDVYEAGSLESGEVFVVAEEPDGESLRELLNNVGVPHLLTSIQIVRQAAEALHAIHLKGLTHRGITPENIILTTDAEHRLMVRVKDLDLGGVIERSIVSNKFFIDSAIESLKYFAPEQCSGEAVGIKADVYGLGIVFYEMLAGAPPFEAEKASELIEKQKEQRPPDIRINNFELRMLISHSLMESLQKRPDKRQSSANGFARQLRHIEQLATHVSTPPPAGVVTAAPPRAAAVVPSLSVDPVTPPAAVKEPRKVTYEEYELPLTPAIEHDQVVVQEAAAIPMPVAAFEKPGDEPAEIPDMRSEMSVVEIAAHVERLIPAPLLRSRLKRHRKELRAKIALAVSTTPHNAPHPLVEPAEIKRVQIPDQAAEVPAIQPPVKPVKIEWQQPEDDIPSVADVLEVLATEQVTQNAHVEPEEIVAVFSAAPPVKLERTLPEEDIPSVANVFEVLATEEIAAGPDLHTEVEEVAVTTPVPPPPTIGEAPRITSPLAANVTARIDAAIRVAESRPHADVQDELEEITLVRPPKSRRIRIDWDRPSPRRRLPAQRPSRTPDEISFVPTILGEARKVRTNDLDPSDAFLSAYYTPSPAASTVPYRSLVVGGGFIALMALVLFGNDSIRTYVQAWGSGESLAAKTTVAKETPPPPRQTNIASPAKKKPLKYFEKPQPVDESDKSTASRAKDRPVLSKDARDPVVNSKTPISRDAERDKGKTKAAKEPSKNSAEKRPASEPGKAAFPGRPRIVKNPRS